MRDYGETTATIWDGNDECKHDWGKEIEISQASSPKDWEKAKFDKNKSAYCKLCGAWVGQLGAEPNPNDYVRHLVQIFDELKKVLKDTGTIWVNLGDTFSGGVAGQGGDSGRHILDGENKYGTATRFDGGVKKDTDFEEKCLLQIPARFAIAMCERGWILRNEIIWYKKNAMPSSTKDRLTIDFEKIFFFAKKPRYFFNQQFEPYTEIDRRTLQGMKEYRYDGGKSQFADEKVDGAGKWCGQGNPMGKNKRAVWSIDSKYDNIEQESEFRQGMNKERGNNLIEKRSLPQQKEFVDRLRTNFTVDKLVEKTGLPKTHIEHWFRYDESGFSFPSKEDWEKVGTELFPELVNVWYEKDSIKSNPFGKNKRTVWEINTRPTPYQHFACFPEELVSTPIDATCPEFVCSRCGQPREKIWEIDRTNAEKQIFKETVNMPEGEYKKATGFTRTVSDIFDYCLGAERKMVGWRECSCRAEFEKGIVLDPFGGSGTTAVVAKKMGRRFLLIELNSDYVAIAQKRIAELPKRLDLFFGKKNHSLEQNGSGSPINSPDT